MFYTVQLGRCILLSLPLGSTLPSVTNASLIMFFVIVVDVLAAAFLVLGTITFIRIIRKQKRSIGKQPQKKQSVMVSLLSQVQRWLSYSRISPFLMLFISIVLFLLVLIVSVLPAVFVLTGQGILGSNVPTTHTHTTGNTPGALSTSLVSDVITPGELTVGTDSSYPPQTYIDPNIRQPTGFDIQLITDVAQQLNLHVNIMQISFANLIGSLNNKNVDVVIAAYTLSDQIKQEVMYVPYLAPAEVVLVLKHNPAQLHVSKLADLCGHKVGVQQNSSEDVSLRNLSCGNNNPVALDELPSADAVAQALAQGQVDATYQDSPTSQYYFSQYKDKFMQLGPRLPAPEEGILVRSGDGAMLQAIQSAFHALVQDGTYASLLKQWNLTMDGLSQSSLSQVGSYQSEQRRSNFLLSRA